jgi:hypothetical protein
MVGDAKTLAHGDRIILGAFATYVGIFIDTAHTKRALFKSSSSSSSLNLLEDVLCFRQSIAEEKEEEEQEQGLEVGLLSPSNNSHDRLEDIIESMDLSITDALREMMFANTMTQPSPQTPLTTVTTTPKATEAVKNKLVGEISMARQQMLEANSIAASLMVHHLLSRPGKFHRSLSHYISPFSSQHRWIFAFVCKLKVCPLMCLRTLLCSEISTTSSRMISLKCVSSVLRTSLFTRQQLLMASLRK